MVHWYHGKTITVPPHPRGARADGRAPGEEAAQGDEGPGRGLRHLPGRPHRGHRAARLRRQGAVRTRGAPAHRGAQEGVWARPGLTGVPQDGRRGPPIVTALPDVQDEALLAAFEAGTIPPAEFHHRDHVRVAWSLVRSCPPVEALTRLSLGLRRLAHAAGKPERYHETITWAFLALVAERLGAPNEGWSEFESRNADLLVWSPSILERYYSPERLGSEKARRWFVLPDRLL